MYPSLTQRLNMQRILFIILTAMCVSSCFKEEAQESECDILRASVKLPNPEAVFYSAADTVAMITPDYASNTIEFRNVQMNADVTAMAS